MTSILTIFSASLLSLFSSASLIAVKTQKKSQYFYVAAAFYGLSLAIIPNFIYLMPIFALLILFLATKGGYNFIEGFFLVCAFVLISFTLFLLLIVISLPFK